MKIVGIYLILNLKIKGIYIGQSIDCNMRLRVHKSNLQKNKNKNENFHLFNAIKKHGYENYKFLFYKKCEEKDLTYNEQWLCDFFRSINWNVYNQRECVDSNKGNKHSKEARQRMSNSRKGEKNSRYGVRLYGIDNPFYGHQHTEETKKKIALSLKGRFSGENNPMYGIRLTGEKNGFFHKKHTEESKRKMSKSHTGVQSGENHPRAKLSWENVKEIRAKYATNKYTLRQLAEEYNVKISCIFSIVKNINWKKNEK